VKILIIGGSGFFGSELALQLKDKHEIIIADKKKPPNFLKDIKFVRCDVTANDLSNNLAIIADVDVVVYSAIIQLPRINEVPNEAWNVNVAGLQRSCEWVEISERCEGLILISSWEVEEKDYEERSKLYRFTKGVQEAIVGWYDMTGTKNYGIVRLGTLLGERMNPNTCAHTFLSSAMKGKPITPFAESLERKIYYVDVQTACSRVEQYIEQMFGEEYAKYEYVETITYSEPITVMELAKIVHGITGAPIKVVGNSPTSTLNRILKSWRKNK